MTPPEDKERDEGLEEEEYVKADKRASREAEEDAGDREETQDATVEEPPEAEDSDATPPEDEPAEAAAEEESTEGERPDINVYSLLRMSIGMYAEQAWIHMGVRMDPNKQKTETKLPLAQIAIDTVAFIAGKLQPDLDANEKREIEQLLANLRINFVQRS